MAGTPELCTADVITEICKKEHIRSNAEILKSLKDQFCDLNTLNFIDSGSITDNGDGTYDIPVTNPASDSIVIDDNLFIYEFDGQDWRIAARGRYNDAGDPRDFGAVYDGVTDCSDAINECIQNYDTVVFKGSGTALCADSIVVRSNTHLKLDHNFRIKLADNTNKKLIKNQWAEQAYFMYKNLVNGAPPSFMPDVYPDYGPVFPSPNYVLGAPDKNIKITGGILDGNGTNQDRQQWKYGTIGYRGVMLQIVNVNGLHIENVRMFNTHLYMTEFALLDNFYINNIHFDFIGNHPNIDGIHFQGECRNGVVSNIYGRTNDDFIAINGGDSATPKPYKGNTVTPEADRVWYSLVQGRVEQISITNLYSVDGYRAVRLLSNRRVNVSPPDETEGMDGIYIDGVYGSYKYDIVFISQHLGGWKHYDLISIKNVNAKVTDYDFFRVDSGVVVKNLILDGVSYQPTNPTRQMVRNEGDVKSLMISNSLINTDGYNVVSEHLIKGSGTIDALKLINVVVRGGNYLALINKSTPTEIIMSDFVDNDYQILVDAPNIEWDISGGSIAEVTLGGNRTIDNPMNLKKGFYSLLVRQDSTGNRTLNFGDAFRWEDGLPPSLTTTSNDVDRFDFISDGVKLYGSSFLNFEGSEPISFLTFNGVDTYVEARNSSVFDVTTGDFDIEVEFRSTENVVGQHRLIDKRGQGTIGTQPSYAIINADDSWKACIAESVNGEYSGSVNGGPLDNPYPNDGNWHTVRLTWDNNTGELTLYQDGTQIGQDVNANMTGLSITTSRLFNIGRASTDAQYFNGDIRKVRFNTETFDFSEGSGSTLTGSEGTVLDIVNATWGSE